MTINELIQKLLATEDESERTKAVEQYTKSKTEDIEKSMQKRINALTAEVHAEKEKTSKAIANEELANSQVTKLKSDMENLKDFEKKYNSIQAEHTAKLREKMQRVMKEIDVPDSDKKYDLVQKVKSRLKLKDKIEDLTPDEIEENLKVYEIYAEAGHFVSTASDNPTYPDSGERKPPAATPKGGVVTQALAAIKK